MANKFNLLKIDEDSEKVDAEKVEIEKVDAEKVETEKVEIEKVFTEVEESEKLKEYDSPSEWDSTEDESESDISEESDEESEQKKKWCACSFRHEEESEEENEEETEEETEEEDDNTDFIYVLYDNDRVKTYSESYEALNEYLEKMIKETTTKYIHLGEIYVHPETKKDGDYYKLFFFQKNMFWKTETVLKIFSIKKVYHL